MPSLLSDSDFSVRSGQPWTATFTYQLDGQSVDLTGWGAALVLKNSLDDATTVRYWSTENGRASVDSVGRIRVAVSADEIGADNYIAPPGEYPYRDFAYQLLLTSNTGVRWSTLNGIFRICNIN